MGLNEKIVVKASISRFFLFHTVTWITVSLIYGFITKSFLGTVVVLCAAIVSIPIGFFLIDANGKNIAIDAEKIEGPVRSTIFTTKRISISLNNVDLSSSKKRPWWMGGSYIASNQGTKVLINNMFLSDEQVCYIFKVLKDKLTNGCT